MKLRNWELNQRIVDWVRVYREEDWREKEGDFDVEIIEKEYLGGESVVCWSIGEERTWREEFRCLTRNWKEKHCWDGDMCRSFREKWEHFDWKHQVLD